MRSRHQGDRHCTVDSNYFDPTFHRVETRHSIYVAPHLIYTMLRNEPDRCLLHADLCNPFLVKSQQPRHYHPRNLDLTDLTGYFDESNGSVDFPGFGLLILGLQAITQWDITPQRDSTAERLIT